MNNFIDKLFNHLVEVNVFTAIVCFAIFMIVLGHQGCINDQLSEKRKTEYLTNCVNKGVAPTECALGWRTARNP